MKLPLAALAAAALALPCHAQTARYLPQPDALRFRTLNEFRMYFVRGTDTLGGPIRQVSVATERWAAAAGGLEATIEDLSLNVGRERKTRVYSVTPRGRITEIDRDPNLERGAYDMLPLLPADGRLAPGAAWSDTVTRTRTDTAGLYVYSAIRDWRVTGTEAGGIVRMEASGTVRYRDHYNSNGVRYWLDVSGPVRETVRFDPARGTRTQVEWSMDLRGQGGLPRQGGGQDTVPAGLVSALIQRPVTAEMVATLTRPLPGADTAFTYDGGGPVLLHTTGRSGAAIVSGMARNDGLVGTARSEWSGTTLRRFESVWTDSTAKPRHFAVEPARGGLRVTGDRDTTVAMPAVGHFAVAEFGMEEHLVPVLTTMAPGAKLALYHPYPNRMEMVTVLMRQLDGGRVYVLQDANSRTALLVDDDGDLLSVAYSTGLGERAPAPGTARRAQAEALSGQVRRASGQR